MGLGLLPSRGKLELRMATITKESRGIPAAATMRRGVILTVNPSPSCSAANTEEFRDVKRAGLYPYVHYCTSMAKMVIRTMITPGRLS